MDLLNTTFYILNLRREFAEAACVFLGFSLIGYYLTDDIQTLLLNFSASKLAFYTIEEIFVTKIKLSFFIGFFLSFPFLIFKTCRLLSREKKKIHPLYQLTATITTSALFWAGVLFCYYFVAPIGIKILLGFGGETLDAALSFEEYILFCVKMILAIGIMFDFPLLMFLFSMYGFLNANSLVRFRKYAILIIAVLAAFISPADIITHVLVMIPLIFIYELSVLFLKIGGKSNNICF